MDFSKVEFSARSFIEEFYIQLMKTPSDLPFALKLSGVPEDIKMMIDSVSRTQNKIKTIPAKIPTQSFDSVDRRHSAMSQIPF